VIAPAPGAVFSASTIHPFCEPDVVIDERPMYGGVPVPEVL
jgi:hypothetical protein